MIILLAKLLIGIPLLIVSDLVFIGKDLVLPALWLGGRMVLRGMIPGQHDAEWIACLREESFCEHPGYYLIGEDWQDYTDPLDERPWPTLTEMRLIYFALLAGRIVYWGSMAFLARVSYNLYKHSSKHKQP